MGDLFKIMFVKNQKNKFKLDSKIDHFKKIIKTKNN